MEQSRSDQHHDNHTATEGVRVTQSTQASKDIQKRSLAMVQLKFDEWMVGK